MVHFFWRHGRTNIIIVLLSVSIILVLTHTSSPLGFLKRGIMNVFFPFQLLGSQIKYSARDFFLSIGELQNVRNENRRLHNEIRRLLNEQSNWQVALQENKRLKDLLDYKQRLFYQSVAARVVSYAPSNWANTLIIDKGSADGVYRLAPVVSYQDGQEGLVGRVIETEKHFSSVLLLHDQNSLIGGQIIRSNFKGVIEGDNYRFCKLKFLPYDATINLHDIIVTSGDGSVFPKGLLIGRVVKVGLKERGLFRDVTVFPFINFSKLEEVIVITNRDYYQSTTLTKD